MIKLYYEGLVDFKAVPGGATGTRAWIKLEVPVKMIETTVVKEGKSVGNIEKLFQELSKKCKHKGRDTECTFKENKESKCSSEYCTLIIRR